MKKRKLLPLLLALTLCAGLFTLPAHGAGLEEIAYIGDRSQCKMDAQMARAYADVLRGLPAKNKWGSPNSWDALLLDPGQDGYPLLLTSTESFDGDEIIYSVPTLWCYKNGQAECCVETDPRIPDEVRGSIGMSVLTTGITNCGPVLVSEPAGGGGPPAYDGVFLYTVSKGQLSLMDVRLMPAHYGVSPVSSSIAISSYEDKYSFEASYGLERITQISNCNSLGWHLPNDPTPASTAISALEAYAATAPSAVAYPATQTVDVDGSPVEFQMYALKDSAGNLTNYVKLRDVASVLNGTDARFRVGWDGSVNIEPGKSYTPNGSEMNTPFSGERSYTRPTAATKIDGRTAELAAIVLTDDQGGGFTYYQLRDLGKALGFNVGWSAGKGVFIETNKPYDPND